MVVVLAGAAVVGNPKPKGPPLDPSATSPDGAKALRLLLQQQGANVVVSPVPPQGQTADVALILQDQLDNRGRADLRAWVQAGGTLVVADPRSDLFGAPPVRAPGAGGFIVAGGPLSPGCAEPALSGVGQIDPAGSRLFRVPRGAEGCFNQSGGAYLIVREVGLGTVVALGSPVPLTNSELAKLDNAVLADALLAPRLGVRVAWINGVAAGGGHRSLADLVPARVEESLAEVGVGLVLLALWRGRRLGRPVQETQPVELPGSELVVAVGNLLHQGHRVNQAASVLRADLARGLADRLGMGVGSSAAVLADATAARTGLDRESILATLAGPPAADEAALIALAQAADAIRQELAHAK